MCQSDMPINNTSTKPNLPIPPPLRGADTGSFAHHSVEVRLPDIARRTLVENEFPPDTIARLEALIREIPHAPIRSFDDTGAPDTEDWLCYLDPYLGQNWLRVPWFFVEAYFYRRILETTGYFHPGAGRGVDPFAYQKRRGLETTQEAIRALSARLNSWLARSDRKRDAFADLLTIDLQGNQADLSMWPADKKMPNPVDKRAHILIDDTAAIADYVSGLDIRTVRADFIMDNAGFELVCDLCLADFLLSSEMAISVRLHLKPHPTFVSDAMIEDVHDTVAFCAADTHADVRALGARLREHLGSERLQLRDDFFWTSPLDMWEMPPALRKDLAKSQLVISKGDANYRRLLGDRHWPFDTPFADVVCYFPAPLAALRMFKSEVVTGLRPDQPKELAQEDPDWLTNGQWGVIQFAR